MDVPKHAKWLFQNRIFVIAVLFSIALHTLFFVIVRIKEFSYKAPKQTKLDLTFFQAKWSDKSVELPGKEYSAGTNTIFAEGNDIANSDSLRHFMDKLFIAEAETNLQKKQFYEAADKTPGEIKRGIISEKPFSVFNYGSVMRGRLSRVFKISAVVEDTASKEIYNDSPLIFSLKGPIALRKLLIGETVNTLNYKAIISKPGAAAFYVCVDDCGDVLSVFVEHSTGFREFDAVILRDIKSWKFEPAGAGSEKKYQSGTVVFEWK